MQRLKKCLAAIRWENVEKLAEVMYWINTQEQEIQQLPTRNTT